MSAGKNRLAKRPRARRLKLRLHPIVHTRASLVWCGPAVLASITGLDTKLIHQCIVDVLGYNVTGMCDPEIVKVLRALGYSSRIYRKGRWLTLEDWTARYRLLFRDRPAIVTVTHTNFNHYIAVLGSRFIDSSLNRSVHISRAKHKRARVMGFILVEAQGNPRG